MGFNRSRVAVIALDAELESNASQIANQLNLPLIHSAQHADFSWVLELTNNGLQLASNLNEPKGTLFLDYLTGVLGFRFKKNEGKNQPLIKAIGYKRDELRVFDVTAGLGRDALVMAKCGCRVTLVERSPVIFALLEDAMRRAAQDDSMSPIIQRTTLIHANAIDWLTSMTNESQPDVIYMDPMYPERTKSAAVKKEMRFLRGLAGDDVDADLLLQIALEKASQRVVVKRPKGAPCAMNLTPTHAIESPNTRYDVYLVKTDPRFRASVTP